MKFNKNEFGWSTKNESSSSSGGGLTTAQENKLNIAYNHSKEEHFSGDYNDLTNKPTNISEFNNDANYVSETYVNNKIDEAQLGGDSGTVDLSGYVTKETGNANQITFADGQTFQAKLDAGILKGEKGEKGEQGIQGIQGDAGATEAIGVTITDVANNFTATNVEGALQEVGSQIKDIKNNYAKKEDIGAPTQEQVNTWLNEHPEATTTVIDGSITPSKLDRIYAEPVYITETGNDIYLGNYTGYIKVTTSESYYVGGRNMLRLPITSQDKDGVTVSLDADGVITINCETALEKDVVFYFNLDSESNFDLNGDYSLTVQKKSGEISGKVSFLPRSGYNNLNGVDYSNIDNKLTINTTEVKTINMICISVKSGTTCNNVKFRWQIELGSTYHDYDYNKPTLYSGNQTINIIKTPCYIYSFNTKDNIKVEYIKSLEEIHEYVKTLKENPPKIDNICITSTTTKQELGLPRNYYERNRPYSQMTGVTIGNGTNTSEITDGRLYPALNDDKSLNDVYRYSVPVAFDNMFPNTTINQTSPLKLGYTIEFYADCSKFEIVGYATYRVEIVADNKFVTTESVVTESTGGYRYVSCDFGSKKKRHIKLYFTDRFIGIITDSNGEITSYKEKRKLIAVEGDSIVEGAGLNTNFGRRYVDIISQMLNLDCYNTAIGGTGFVATVNDKPNLVDRFETHVLPYNPDIFMVACGLNDNSLDIETVKINIDTYFEKLKTNLSDKQVIIVSPFNPNASLIPNVEIISNYIKNKALECNFPFIDTCHMKSYDFIGNIITDNTNSSLDGNIINEERRNKFYKEYIDGTSSDPTHPNRKGHYYLGLWIGNEICKILNNSLN